jgi:hypothetical protein
VDPVCVAGRSLRCGVARGARRLGMRIMGGLSWIECAQYIWCIWRRKFVSKAGLVRVSWAWGSSLCCVSRSCLSQTPGAEAVVGARFLRSRSSDDYGAVGTLLPKPLIGTQKTGFRPQRSTMDSQNLVMVKSRPGTRQDPCLPFLDRIYLWYERDSLGHSNCNQVLSGNEYLVTLSYCDAL